MIAEFEGQLLLSIPTFATFTIELVKWIYRKFVVKDMEFDFPKIFYGLMLPFITAFWRIFFGYIGWSDAVKFELVEIVQWSVMIVVTLILYQWGVKPLTGYQPEN